MVASFMRDMAKATAPLANRAKLMVCRAILKMVDDAAGLQTVQVKALEGDLRDGAERFQQYGFSSHPLVGAEGVALAVGGATNHTVIIAIDDRRYRVKGLTGGEVAIYDDQGQTIVLKRSGIEVNTPFNVTVNAAGNATVTAQGTARMEGDAVQIHAKTSLKLDCGGYGETWLPSGRRLWTQSTTTSQMGPPMPPEHP